jgi:hypothetical protein
LSIKIKTKMFDSSLDYLKINTPKNFRLKETPNRTDEILKEEGYYLNKWRA